MQKICNFIKYLPMRWKLTATVLVILGSLLLSVSIVTSRYYTSYYTQLQQRYNENAIQQVSLQLDGILSNIDTLYLTFNSQNIFTPEAIGGSTYFQRVQNQISFEKMVNNVINANNLQDLLIGTLFYLNEDCFYYVGSGAIEKQLDLTDKQWFQDFSHYSGTRMIVGPQIEDFKSVDTQRYTCIYYIAPYGIRKTSGFRSSFILFSVKLDSLMELLEKCTVADQPLIVINSSGDLLHTTGLSEEITEELLPDLQEKISSGGNSFTFFSGDKYISSYYHEGFDLWIVFVDEAKSIFVELTETSQKINIIIAAFTIIGILAAAGIIKRMTMPLKVLNDFLDIMERDPDAYINADPHTETGRIGVRLNEMKQKNEAMGQEVCQLQLQERDAHVSALQSQINPHFIYNTLDNIYCLAQLGETDLITSLSEHLSQMMRYSLSMKQRIAPLRLELQHCQSYVAILNIRFENKIKLINKMEERFYDVPVLKLSLQPIVENAWQHSLRLCDNGGTVILRTNLRSDVLEIWVENTGICLTEDHFKTINQTLEAVHFGQGNPDRSHGIALENINNRLKLSFGSAYGLKLYPREGGGCKVIMKVPFSLGKT